MKIEVKNINDTEIAEKDIFTWPIWACGISEFDWEYDQKESCLLLEGEVEVKSDFETVKFGGGDFVVFPKGLKCKWKIIKPVKKHYSFI